MLISQNQYAFFELLRAGLWEKEARLSQYNDIDFGAIMRLAEEQSVIGLITAGLERVADLKVPKEITLQFVGSTLQIERQNQSMNDFINWLLQWLKEENVRTLIVKGQGIAQCYERPLWRLCGDVDFIVDEENYKRGKIALSKVATFVHEENPFDKHFSVDVKGFVVELHGSMRSMLTKRADDSTDAIQEDAFRKDKKRVWDNKGTSVFLPCPDDDIIFVFTHILKHFFHYGIGLRQVCDWCRLLYTYHNEMDINLLESRLKSMGLMSEWKVFSSMTVNWLGMPVEAMPFYSPANCWKRKGDRAMSFILETGNFGHKRDNSRYRESSATLQKLKSLWQHTCDSARHFFIFPIDAVKIWCRMFALGISDAFKGK